MNTVTRQKKKVTAKLAKKKERGMSRFRTMVNSTRKQFLTSEASYVVNPTTASSKAMPAGNGQRDRMAEVLQSSCPHLLRLSPAHCSCHPIIRLPHPTFRVACSRDIVVLRLECKWSGVLQTKHFHISCVNRENMKSDRKSE